MMTVVYAFQGCEIMGVAAGETEHPEKSILALCATWCSAS